MSEKPACVQTGFNVNELKNIDLESLSVNKVRMAQTAVQSLKSMANIYCIAPALIHVYSRILLIRRWLIRQIG